MFELPFGRVGIAICYDGWFPKTFRSLALACAELVCVPTNWVPMAGPRASPRQWRTFSIKRLPIRTASSSPALTGRERNADSVLSGTA
nr:MULTISPECIES: nitrilase-related carbon-nitrogen hydrolase [Ensifer]